MFKKIMSLFVVLGMILCLSACNNEKMSSKPTENKISTKKPSQESKEQSAVEETYNKPDAVIQTKPTHTHSYSVATCTSPQKCSCGAAAGTALGHNFANASCTSPQICSRCGVTNGSALGHSYSDATCTSAKKCSRCSNTNGSALGHNYVNNKCSRCGKVDPESLPKDLFSAHPPYETKGCSNKTVKINGETFANAFVMTGGYADGSGAHAYFNLGAKYSVLNFEIGHVDASPLENEILEIIMDGVLVKTINLNATELKKQYTLQISGVNQLIIKQSYTVAKYAIVNAQLKK